MFDHQSDAVLFDSLKYLHVVVIVAAVVVVFGVVVAVFVVSSSILPNYIKNEKRCSFVFFIPATTTSG